MSDNILTFREVGAPFKFLGIPMVVMTHREEKNPNKDEREAGCCTIPARITVMYADRHGILQEHHFYNEDLPALLTQCGPYHE